MAVTHESPLLARIGAWSLERYHHHPVINILVYLRLPVCGALGQEVIDFSVERDLLGPSRSLLPLDDSVFDEHKDYEEDVHNTPTAFSSAASLLLGT